MLEVPPGTLRSWEERYALVVPERGEGGQRVYSRDQLEQLRFVVAQMGSGLSAADAHRVLAGRTGEDGSRWLTLPQTDARVVILLAERDPYAAEFTDYFLRTEGYEVVTTLDAHDAQAQYEDKTPQVVVVDMQISGGAGPVSVGPSRTGDRVGLGRFDTRITGRSASERCRRLPAEAAGPAPAHLHRPGPAP